MKKNIMSEIHAWLARGAKQKLALYSFDVGKFLLEQRVKAVSGSQNRIVLNTDFS